MKLLFRKGSCSCILSVISILLIITSSCNGARERSSDRESEAAIYYWRTNFDLTEEEYKFLTENNISKLYLHCFDVDVVETSNDSKSVEPIVTTTFGENGYSGSAEIIPTVFLTIDALREISDVEYYARLIVERALAITRYNKLGETKEMQIDCDWTSTTEAKFFKLCSAMKSMLSEYAISLSATIRLHQLNSTPPPVDRGMLMLYNTGALRDEGTTNSILDYSDVAPYLKNQIKYGIPLDIALPVYSWGVSFRDGEFQRIISRPNLNTNSIKKLKENWYKVVNPHTQGDKELIKGDRIRYEAPSAKEILKVKRLVLQQIQQEGSYRLTLFHLDINELNKYSKDEIQSLYRQ